MKLGKKGRKTHQSASLAFVLKLHGLGLFSNKRLAARATPTRGRGNAIVTAQARMPAKDWSTDDVQAGGTRVRATGDTSGRSERRRMSLGRCRGVCARREGTVKSIGYLPSNAILHDLDVLYLGRRRRASNAGIDADGDRGGSSSMTAATGRRRSETERQMGEVEEGNMAARASHRMSVAHPSSDKRLPRRPARYRRIRGGDKRRDDGQGRRMQEGVSMKMRGRYTTRRESNGASDVGDEIVPDCTLLWHPYFQTASRRLDPQLAPKRLQRVNLIYMIPRELERHDKFDPSTLDDLRLNAAVHYMAYAYDGTHLPIKGLVILHKRSHILFTLTARAYLGTR
ncbi:hypothetical protein B0H13DRAFT_1912288 [Mycena leptocephala]|nr:hypothetical protein B0H13DRAFT_1912288 [Mycena leptocephala]